MTSEKSKKINFSEIISKYKIPIIIVLALALLVIIVTFLSNANASRDPFEKLYDCQTRESVRVALGTPDRSEDKDPNEDDSWNLDEYYNVKFLSKSGNLVIWYDDDNYATRARFTYDYPVNSNNPGGGPASKERVEVIEYALSIIAFYAEKYEMSAQGNNAFRWYSADGKSMGLHYDLSLNDLDPAIQIFWGL